MSKLWIRKLICRARGHKVIRELTSVHLRDVSPLNGARFEVDAWRKACRRCGYVTESWSREGAR